MNSLTGDFETKSRIDLKKCGIYRYASDPSTEAMCMAYGTTKADVKLWIAGMDPEKVKRRVGDSIFHAHNASFERQILKYKFSLDLPPSRFRCSAARAMQSGLPRSLENDCSYLGLAEGKDKAGHELMKTMVKPGKKGDFDNDPDKLKRLYQYCGRDVIAEIGLEEALPPVSPFMQAAWEAHEAMNDRGIPVDRDLVIGAVKILDDVMEETANKVYRITDGKISKGTQNKKILQFVQERGVNIDDLRGPTVAEALEDENLHPEARDVLLLRQESSGVAAGKHRAILNFLMADSRVRGSYVFPGAHTARAASWGIQVMNLKKMAGSGFPTEEKGKAVAQEYLDAIYSGKLSAMEDLKRGMAYETFDILTMLGYAVRAAFCAKPDHTFIFRDLSQIEVRLAHWFTLNESIMDLFRAKGDIYKDFASKFFKVPVSEVTPEQRQLAKPIVLGCNYGMGATRLAVYAKTYRVYLTDEEAQVYVQAFRRLYPRIPQLWKALEKAAILCTMDGKTRKVGRLFAGIEGKWFYFELPSGRRVYYLNPEVKKGKDGTRFQFFSHRGHVERTWGGTLLENLCQAGTADLTNITITRAEEAGLCPIINQHDEVGIEVQTAYAKEAGEEFGRLIEMGTEWTGTLPVGSDMAMQKRWIK